MESGEKLLHLYPVPGSRDEIRGKWGKHYAGRKVWYFYYDTLDSNQRDKCLEENEDIVKLPSDVPIRIKKWDNLNSPSKNKVRRLSVAYVKKYLATMKNNTFLLFLILILITTTSCVSTKSTIQNIDNSAVKPIVKNSMFLK